MGRSYSGGNAMKYIYSVFILLILLTSSCKEESADTAERYLILASALTKLSASVESTVRYKNPPENMTDNELLLLSTKHDPSLLEPFSDYTVKAIGENRHAIVLICLKNNNKAILEDAGCSKELDLHHWKEKEMPECSFTLNVTTACAN